LQTHFTAYKNSSICFGIIGSGPTVIVCLHGFGENRSSFDLLEKSLGKKYTLLCLDLPFHGETEWNEGLSFKPEDFPDIIELVLEKAGLKKEETFSLLAYSLGGRIALQLLQTVPQRIERIVLLAPDGLRINFWYWLGTQTYIGSKLFYFTMKKPAWFFAMANLAHKVGLLNKSIIKFVHHYLDDAEVRVLLYKRWTTLRKFRPELAVVRKNIAANKIPARFVFGSYDRIILHKRSDVFKTDKVNIKVEVLQAGHQLLKGKHVADIAKQFSN
jgi:pimeloyl-ACP methyl ester carboxylesterase